MLHYHLLLSFAFTLACRPAQLRFRWRRKRGSPRSSERSQTLLALADKSSARLSRISTTFQAEGELVPRVIVVAQALAAIAQPESQCECNICEEAAATAVTLTATPWFQNEMCPAQEQAGHNTANTQSEPSEAMVSCGE
jgi:hypothetical protein